MKYFLFSALVVSLVACKDLEPASPSYFFSVDSLVEAQIDYLTEKGAKVTKTGMVIGQGMDSVTIMPDSLQWARELAIFKSADINKPRLRERYEKHVKSLDNGLEQLSYIPTDSAGLMVNKLTITYDADPNNLREIHAIIVGNNPLYSSQREIRMNFEEVGGAARLKTYFVQGGQKMKLKDSVQFDLHGKLVYPNHLK